MLDRGLFRHSVKGCELVVGNIAAVLPEPVDSRNVALEEHLELAHVDELVRVCDDGFQEPAVLLIPPELFFPVT